MKTASGFQSLEGSGWQKDPVSESMAGLRMRARPADYRFIVRLATLLLANSVTLRKTVALALSRKHAICWTRAAA